MKLRQQLLHTLCMSHNQGTYSTSMHLSIYACCTVTFFNTKQCSSVCVCVCVCVCMCVCVCVCDLTLI